MEKVTKSTFFNAITANIKKYTETNTDAKQIQNWQNQMTAQVPEYIKLIYGDNSTEGYA